MRRLRLTLVAVGALAASASPARARGGSDCPPNGAVVVVRTEPHELLLCEDGRPSSTFHVRLASGGVGKSRAGDQKVPVGRYALGAPRASRKFGVFVPIGYPSPEQIAAGFTGGEIGIHGPHRAMRWVGRWANAFDTTDGCVGLATDGEINEIAAWLRRNKTAGIDIRPPP